MGDNGNSNPEIKPEVKVLLTIGVNKDNVIVVGGDLNNKQLCYHLLAEAIKIITDYKPKVIQPNLPIHHRIMNFARHLKRGG